MIKISFISSDDAKTIINSISLGWREYVILFSCFVPFLIDF